MSKYIIEVDDNAVADNSCYPIVGTNSVLVSTNGLDGLEEWIKKKQDRQKRLLEE